MGSKHDILTEEELSEFSLSKNVELCLQEFADKYEPPLKPEQVNVLDWGCGRGRSVAKLLEKGYNVYGIDIENKVLQNGYPLFEKRGLKPENIIFHIDQLDKFEDNFFHVIFSEQVLEHVEDIHSMIHELARLTAPGGIGIHQFPGKYNINEGHLFMPFVHWLPKNNLRKSAIALLLAMGKGPKTRWPEAVGKKFWEVVDVYYTYLNQKTYYRDIKNICGLFHDNGFDVTYEITSNFLRKYCPVVLLRNGYPRGSINIFTRKNG